MKPWGSTSCLCILVSFATIAFTRNADAFVPLHRPSTSFHVGTSTEPTYTPTSPTALNVWWFGGEENEYDNDADSCELVAVRIEKPSANSRRILGDITVDLPIDDVWAILTDYDRLAVHVPNLKESKRVGRRQGNGEQGDGQYTCRLYQKGAQKIVGFDFSASVTMDMKESMLRGGQPHYGQQVEEEGVWTPEERRISFKCVESRFFSEFDGEWKAVEELNADGQPSTTLSYSVDVRPKGPVPVAALEWRIREDVPSNLRAVKRAAEEVGYEGVMASRQQQTKGQERVRTVRQNLQRNARAVRDTVRDKVVRAASKQNLVPVTIPISSQTNWETSETMAKYLQ